LFQVEPDTYSEQVAIDRLALLLSSSIGIQKQLRIQAKDPCKLPIIVFGATSAGELWKLYVAHEPEPWHYGIVCVRLDRKHEFHNRLTRGDDQNICTIWTGMIQEEDSCNSVEFLWLMERIKRWSLDNSSSVTNLVGL